MHYNNQLHLLVLILLFYANSFVLHLISSYLNSESYYNVATVKMDRVQLGLKRNITPTICSTQACCVANLKARCWYVTFPWSE